MRLRILTVLWGPEFVSRFLRFGMRSLLAPGNLPEVCQKHHVTYDVHAPADDIELIRNDPAFAALAQVVEVRFYPFLLSDIDANNPMSHWSLWQWAVAQARRDDVYVMLAAPDQIFCRGTLARWAELFEQGRLAIFASGFQIVAETFAEEVTARFPGGQPIDLSPGELRALMFRHLHPIKIAMFRNSPRLLVHPEWHLRSIPGEGFLQRILSSHAYAFHPGRIRLTENFCPTEKFEQVAFEPSCFLGVEPLLKYLGLYFRRWRMDDAALSYYGTWVEKFVLPVNSRESAIAHAYPIQDAIGAAALRRAQLGGDFYLGQMRASGMLVRLWHALRDSGCDQAARWVAVAHLHARARRRLPIAGAATLFVPAEEVLQRMSVGQAGALVADGGRALIATCRMHLAPGHHALSPGDRLGEAATGEISTKDGRRYAKMPRGAIKVLRGPIRVDDVHVYVVDRLLGPHWEMPGGLGVFRSAQIRIRGIGRRLARKAKVTLLSVLGSDRRVLALAISVRERARGMNGNKSDAGGGLLPPDSPAFGFYRRAMAARGLDGLREVYRFYAEDVLAGRAQSAPQARLAQLPTFSTADVAALLVDAVGRSPSFAEAWLELGYLRLEEADEDRALAAFELAQAGTPLLPPHSSQTDPRLIAAMERAAILSRRGMDETALAALETVPTGQPIPWSFHLLRARLLLALGRIEAALLSFEKCLEWRLMAPGFAGRLPADLDELTEALG